MWRLPMKNKVSMKTMEEKLMEIRGVSEYLYISGTVLPLTSHSSQLATVIQSRYCTIIHYHTGAVMMLELSALFPLV